MYVPPANRVDDETEAVAFVEAHPFAVLCVNGPDGPVVAHVPLVVEKNEAGVLVALIGHFARANPIQAQIGEAGTPVVAVFRGADAYVSPSLYPSKKLHGKVVPTWAYLAAEARGTIVMDTDPTQMATYLRPLTEKMESHRPVPWAISDAPDDYMAKMSNAIIGFRIEVTSLIAKRKINQGKPEADYQGVLSAFAASDVPNEQTLSHEMTKESVILS